MHASSPIISFGLVDGHPLFLDARSDSYFMLDDEDEGPFLSTSALGLPLPADRRLRDLLSVGGEPATIIRAEWEEPARSIAQEQLQAPSLVDLARAAWLVNSSRKWIASRPIEKVIEDICASNADGVADGSIEPLLAKTRRFHAARKLVPIKANCLLDSLALLRWLGPGKASAMLVFGAKLEPFAAHCWLQAGDVLLNDALDVISRFRAVRVVRCSPATP